MTTQEETIQTRKPRMTDLLLFLKKEIVGNELLFTADHARRVVEELGFHGVNDAWNTLRRLEKNGQVVLKKKKAGKGILVSLNANEPQVPTAEKPVSPKQTRRGKRSNTLTVPQLLSQLETESRETPSEIPPSPHVSQENAELKFISAIKTEQAQETILYLTAVLEWFLLKATAEERNQFRDTLGKNWERFLELTRAMQREGV